MVCTAVVVLGLTVGILFLEETHEDRKNDYDRGIAAGQWLLRKVWGQDAYAPLSDKDAPLEEERRAMLGCGPAPTYNSTDSLPTLFSNSEPLSFALEKEAASAPSAFTKQVCLNIVCYGILAL